MRQPKNFCFDLALILLETTDLCRRRQASQWPAGDTVRNYAAVRDLSVLVEAFNRSYGERDRIEWAKYHLSVFTVRW